MTGASVYIVLCSDRSYYTGLTRRSVEERVNEHNQGLDADSYTFPRRPVRLVFSACFDRIVEAIATERRIKGWSRAKKEALIRGDYDALPKLAARRTVGRNNSGTPFETRPAGAPQGEGNCEVLEISTSKSPNPHPEEPAQGEGNGEALEISTSKSPNPHPEEPA